MEDTTIQQQGVAVVASHERLRKITDETLPGENRVNRMVRELGLNNLLVATTTQAHQDAWGANNRKTPELTQEYGYGFTLGYLYGVAFAQALVEEQARS